MKACPNSPPRWPGKASFVAPGTVLPSVLQSYLHRCLEPTKRLAGRFQAGLVDVSFEFHLHGSTLLSEVLLGSAAFLHRLCICDPAGSASLQRLTKSLALPFGMFCCASLHLNQPEVVLLFQRSDQVRVFWKGGGRRCVILFSRCRGSAGAVQELRNTSGEGQEVIVPQLRQDLSHLPSDPNSEFAACLSVVQCCQGRCCTLGAVGRDGRSATRREDH